MVRLTVKAMGYLGNLAKRLLRRLPFRVQYLIWVILFDRLSVVAIKRIQDEIVSFHYHPVFSILMPTYEAPWRYLIRAVRTVKRQQYRNWELCIVDDASQSNKFRRRLTRLAATDNRISLHFRETHGGIANATNDALNTAHGEFCTFLDQDDELSPDALFRLASVLNCDPTIDFMYSDEDKLDRSGLRFAPYFKPDWSPDTLLCKMYTCHLSVYRTAIMKALDGMRDGFSGSQDHDLALRVSEVTTRITHIPRILYHWRAARGSTARDARAKPYAQDSGLKAVQSALDRRGEGGVVSRCQGYPGYHSVRYRIADGTRISIIIPTCGRLKNISMCVSSIFRRSTFRDFEVILVDNSRSTNSECDIKSMLEPEFRKAVSIVLHNGPFNYSSICNHGGRIAQGDLFLFLNDDTEVITPEWLEAMGGFASRRSIGAVGAMLLFADKSIQHAGIVLGIGGIANHHHRGFPADSPGKNMGQLITQANYSAVTGACLMLKREDFEKVNGFDERLAVAFNDVDLCLKLRKLGRYNIVLPEIKLVHYESISRGRNENPEHSSRFRNEISWMESTWGDAIRSDPFYNRNLTLESVDYGLRFFGLRERSIEERTSRLCREELAERP